MIGAVNSGSDLGALCDKKLFRESVIYAGYRDGVPPQTFPRIAACAGHSRAPRFHSRSPHAPCTLPLHLASPPTRSRCPPTPRRNSRPATPSSAKKSSPFSALSAKTVIPPKRKNCAETSASHSSPACSPAATPAPSSSRATPRASFSKPSATRTPICRCRRRNQSSPPR